MAFTTCSVTASVIAGLGTTPAERALATDDFKAKFDEFATNFVAWFNATHIAEANAHLAETMSYYIYASRDISVEGDQTISLVTGRTPKSIVINGHIQGIDSVSNGYAASNGQGCVTRSPSGSTQAIGGKAIYLITTAAGDAVQGAVTMQNGGIKITWSKASGSPTGTAGMIIMALYHD